MIKAIFLDKDGVINENINGSPRSLDEFKFKPNVELTLEILNSLGYFNIVVTNQPDIERGLITKEKLVEMFDYMQKNCSIHKIYVCPSADDNNPFKKPNIGMFKQAETENRIDLKESYMVGDTWKDIEAGKNAGCKTIYVKQDHNYDEEVANKADYVVTDIIEIVDIIINNDYQRQFFNSVFKIALSMREDESIAKLIEELLTIKANNGRVFFVGAGGGSGNASHAACDFKKLLGIESYSITDNTPELTARINDDGWEESFVGLLKSCNLSSKDAIFILSVGGGSIERNVSINIVKSIDYAKSIGARVLGIVGLMEGYTYKNSDCAIHIPAIFPKGITPLTESFQSVILHMLATHPKLQEYKTVW